MPRDSRLNIVVSLKNQASRKLRQLRKDIDSVNPNISRAATNARRFSVGLTAVAGGAVYAGKQLADVADRYERTSIAFETMLGDAEEAEQMLSDLGEFAKRTPFDIQGIRENAKKLMGMGIEARNVLPALKTLGDVSAGTGAELSRLALNFGQVRAKGKLTGRELRDFATAGVDLTGVIAEMTGKTEAQIQEMVSAGEVTYPMVAKAFENMTEEGGRFNDLMFRMADTTTGAINALKESWTVFVENNQEVQKLNELIEKLARRLAEFIDRDLPQFIALIKKSVKWLKEHKVVLMAIAGALGGVLLLAFASAATAVAGFLATLAPFIIGGAVIMGLLQSFFEIDQKIADFIEGLGEAKESVGGWGHFFEVTFVEMEKVVIDWAIAVLEQLESVIEAMADFKSSISPLIARRENRELKRFNDTIADLRKESNKLSDEAKRLAEKYAKQAIETEKAKEEMEEFTTGAFDLEAALSKAGQKGGEAMEDLRDKTINALQKIQDRFLGLRDKEIGALQKVADAHKEKMDIIEERRKKELEGRVTEEGMEIELENLRQTSEAYKKHAKKYEEAMERINKLKMGRRVTPVSAVTEWAEETKSALEKRIKGMGATPPTGTYPRLQPISLTPQQAVNNFNFNFEGALISNPDEFKREIINLLNQMSERKSLGGE